LAKAHGLRLPLLSGIVPSNDEHRAWPFKQVMSRLGPLVGQTVAVLGLAYKPGTSAIRRSVAIELLRGLVAGGATVRAHDPAVRALPTELAAVTIAPSAEVAAQGAHCLVLATEWPEYGKLTAEQILPLMSRPLIIDQSRFLDRSFALDPRIEFVTVGKPS
jgi:UDPglucose 6-dehydrogenase